MQFLVVLVFGVRKHKQHLRTSTLVPRYFGLVDLQRYVSPDLTHFVGRGLGQEAQFKLLKKIIRQGLLQARPHDRRTPPNTYAHSKYISRNLSSNKAYKGAIVCFCDIPLADLYLHMRKYSPFGLAFRKTFLVEHGVAPVMYVPALGRPSLLHFYDPKPGSPLPTRGISSQTVAFDRFWRYLNHFHKKIEDGGDAALVKDWHRVVEFLDLSVLSYLKFFDHRLYDDHKKNYYMEREWRSSKDVEFDLIDIQRIIIPPAFSGGLRRAFPDYDGEVFFAD